MVFVIQKLQIFIRAETLDLRLRGKFNVNKINKDICA
jgi:hypothetical protein